MGMNPTTLADALKLIGFPASLADFLEKAGEGGDPDTGWIPAWNAFWEESVATAVPANETPAPAEAAFSAGITGLYSDGQTSIQAATIIKDAIKAFWLAATPVLAYGTTPPPAPGPYLTPPPFMLDAGAEQAFVNALALVFDTNTATSASEDAALTAVAAAIYAAPQAGATFLDTTTPTPITYTVA